MSKDWGRANWQPADTLITFSVSSNLAPLPILVNSNMLNFIRFRTQSIAKQGDIVAERNRWSWLGHLARSTGYLKCMLLEINSLPIINITTDIRKKYGQDWMQKAMDKHEWKNAFDTYILAQPAQERTFRSQIQTRNQLREEHPRLAQE